MLTPISNSQHWRFTWSTSSHHKGPGGVQVQTEFRLLVLRCYLVVLKILSQYWTDWTQLIKTGLMFKGGHRILRVPAVRTGTGWLTPRPSQDHPASTPSFHCSPLFPGMGEDLTSIFLLAAAVAGQSGEGCPLKYCCQHLMLLQQWFFFQAALWGLWEAAHICPTAVPPNPTRSTECHLMVTGNSCIPSSLFGVFSVLKKWQDWHRQLLSLWTIKLLWI